MNEQKSPPPPPPPPPAPRYRRPRPIVWPAILIILGILFLLANFGLLPSAFWSNVLQFWPLILILIGLAILLGRGGGEVVAVIIIVIVVLAILGAGFFVPQFAGFRQGAATSSLTQPLDNVRDAQVTVEFGAGNLQIGSLPAGSTNLMEGNFTHPGGIAPLKGFSTSGSTGILRLSQASGGRTPFGAGTQDWNVRLTSEIPLQMTVRVGAASVTLDLSALKLSGLTFDGGATTANFRFPRPSGTVSTQIRAGASNLDIIVPPDAEASITADLGLTTLNVDARFVKSGNTYTTSGYNKATDRLNLTVRTGASTVNIR